MAGIRAPHEGTLPLRQRPVRVHPQAPARRLKILARVAAAAAGHAFTFLDYGNPRTTSAVEGGVNAQIRRLLHHHRGMPIAHRRRAIEWFLLLREFPLEHALASANQPQPPSAPPQPEPDEPTL